MRQSKRWQMDLQRYGGLRALLREQSLWAIAIHRLGAGAQTIQQPLLRKILVAVWWPLFRVIETAVGISLPKEADIGGGLLIWHFGNVFIHPNAKIGCYCTLRQGVTVGNRRDNGSVPCIGNHVEIGAYAQLLGGISIGDGAKIGAMSVVLKNVGSNQTVVGNPARVVVSESESINVI